MSKKVQYGDPVDLSQRNLSGAGRPMLRTASLLWPYSYFIKCKFRTMHSAMLALPWEQYLGDEDKGVLSYNEFSRIVRMLASRPLYVEAVVRGVINYAVRHRHANELKTLLENFRHDVPPELYDPAAKEVKLGVSLPPDLPSARDLVSKRGA